LVVSGSRLLEKGIKCVRLELPRLTTLLRIACFSFQSNASSVCASVEERDNVERNFDGPLYRHSFFFSTDEDSEAGLTCMQCNVLALGVACLYRVLCASKSNADMSAGATRKRRHRRACSRAEAHALRDRGKRRREKPGRKQAGKLWERRTTERDPR
jgi:hypothetical protein